METQFSDTILKPLDFLPSERCGKLSEQEKVCAAVDDPCLHTRTSPQVIAGVEKYQPRSLFSVHA